MSEQQIKAQIKAIDKGAKKATSSKEAALHFLEEAGILQIIKDQNNTSEKKEKVN